MVKNEKSKEESEIATATDIITNLKFVLESIHFLEICRISKVESDLLEGEEEAQTAEYYRKVMNALVSSSVKF